MSLHRFRFVLLSCVAALAIGCGAPAAQSPAQSQAPAGSEPAVASAPAGDVKAKLDEYYQKARTSGETRVVHYGGGGEEWLPIIKAFRERYPAIEVEKVLQRGPEMIQRITAEAASGKYVGTVASHGQTTMTTSEAQGLFTQWEGPPTAAQLPEIPLTTGGVRWAMSENLYGYILNTSLVPADKHPKTRQDILDPFFKGAGKLVIEDPRAGGPGLDVFTVNYVQLGQAYLDAVKAQDPTFIRDRELAPVQVARGEYAIFYPVGTTKEVFDLQQSAPTKVDWMRDGGSTSLTSTIGVIKNAPGQDASKLYVSWLLSEEGQRNIVEHLWSHAALPGIPPPAGVPPMSEINPSKRTEDQIKRNNEYIEIFDKTFFR